MSIIHDALKKVQNKTPPEVKILPPKQKKIKTVLTLLCTIAIILGSLGFLYNQWHAYFPKVKKLAKLPENLVPLAKLTVNPPVPTKLPAISNTPKTSTPVTLNIHGVMSDGPNNVVLINDQVYQEGDEVDGVKIVKISLDSIIVINNGKEETIRVKN
jgi:type II secretory pathway component PulC